MRFLKHLFPAFALLFLFATVGLATADNNELMVENTAQSGTELTQELYWPEAGITIMHPEDWQLVNDPNFDFVLVGEQIENDEGGFELAYVTMESGSLGNTSVQEIMASFDGVEGDDLLEFTIGDVSAYRFNTDSASGAGIFIGFTPDNATLFLMGMFASESLWGEWEAVFESMIEAMVVDELVLDNAALNAQMQANYEATGRLTIGNLDAPVEIYEFLDFACPHCVDFHYSLNRVVQDYVVTGQANISFGLLTFVGGELSENASAAQVCGAQLGIGWDVHNIIFDSYREQGGAQAGYNADVLLAAIEAAELDVDMAAFNACFAESTGLDEFLQLTDADADQYGVSSTPVILFASEGEDFSFMMSGSGEPITRTNLYFTYDYIESLLDKANESAQ